MVDKIEYIVFAVALFFIVSITVSLIVIHWQKAIAMLKNIMSHTLWLTLWIPSFFVSFKLALLIPAAWLGYILFHYERKNLKVKASQAAKAA